MTKRLEQSIAVFGESGSGKTVMLSALYGAMQEPDRLRENLFSLTADDTTQGTFLQRNYLGMRDSAQLPMATRFESTEYHFTLRPHAVPGRGSGRGSASSKQHSEMHLVWHDYPGEWFEQSVSGPAEAARKVATFRSLLSADVAVLLVDGQRLLDNAGQEERYLKSLLTNFRNGLLSLKGDILEGGKPLVQFPRIWLIALSKADLLPSLDVFAFRDLVIGRAGEDLVQLRNVIAQFVESSDALSVGEDFLLLSSAEFGAHTIEVRERVGIDLILPLAWVLPFERHLRWAEAKHVSRRVAENLLISVSAIATAVTGRKLFPSLRFGPMMVLVGVGLKAVTALVDLAGSKLKRANVEAVAKKDAVVAILTKFKLELEESERRNVLLRSRR